MHLQIKHIQNQKRFVVHFCRSYGRIDKCIKSMAWLLADQAQWQITRWSGKGAVIFFSIRHCLKPANSVPGGKASLLIDSHKKRIETRMKCSALLQTLPQGELKSPEEQAGLSSLSKAWIWRGWDMTKMVLINIVEEDLCEHLFFSKSYLILFDCLANVHRKNQLVCCKIDYSHR